MIFQLKHFDRNFFSFSLPEDDGELNCCIFSDSIENENLRFLPDNRLELLSSWVRERAKLYINL
jgi:hypothetical protein